MDRLVARPARKAAYRRALLGQWRGAGCRHAGGFPASALPGFRASRRLPARSSWSPEVGEVDDRSRVRTSSNVSCSVSRRASVMTVVFSPRSFAATSVCVAPSLFSWALPRGCRDPGSALTLSRHRRECRAVVRAPIAPLHSARDVSRETSARSRAGLHVALADVVSTADGCCMPPGVVGAVSDISREDTCASSCDCCVESADAGTSVAAATSGLPGCSWREGNGCLAMADADRCRPFEK